MKFYALGLILEKAFPSMISSEKRIRFTLFLLTKVKIVQKIRKIPEITNDHNFGTEYARTMKLESQCAVLLTLLYFINNSISTKMDLGPFGNELFILYQTLGYCYLEFKLRYLKNLEFFLIRAKIII